jgi:glucose repression regulatory protein TUP1
VSCCKALSNAGQIGTLWDIQKEKILQTFSEHSNDLNTLCDVSADGRWLVTPSSDNTVRVWEINASYNIN